MANCEPLAAIKMRLVLRGKFPENIMRYNNFLVSRLVKLSFLFRFYFSYPRIHYFGFSFLIWGSL